ncbi:MAG: hypothetical protein PHR00_03490 [Patescibacteria group bacterium]|nr:hypothetical protein [Patescibacteria group bacterium]
MQKIYTKKNIKLIAISFVIISLILIGLRLKISGGIAGGDSIRYYTYLKTIALDHNLDFETQLDYYRQTKSKFTGLVKYPSAKEVNLITGRSNMLYPIGTTICWYPFFVFGHLTSNIFYWLSGNDFYLSGFSMIHYYFVSISALLYVLLAAYVIYRYLVKAGNDKRIVFLSIATIILGSSLTYYIYFVPTYAHALSFCWSSIFLVYFLSKYKECDFNRKSFFVLGILLAMVYLIRYQDVLVAIIPAYLIVYDLLVSKNKRFLNTYKTWPFFIFGFFLLLTPQLLINKYLHGGYLLSGYNAYGFDYWLKPKILFSLFSLHKGVFILTPIVAVALIGVFTKIKDKLYQALFLFFAAEIYVISAWSFYHQGESFGSRMMICCSIVYIFGLLPVLKRLKNVKIWLPWAFSLFFVLINWILMVLFAFRIIGTPYGSLY